MLFFQKLLSWLFPPCCAVCKKEGFFLCPSCFFRIPRKPKMEILHQKMMLFSFFPYKEKSVSAVVKACKYQFQEEIFLPFQEDFEKNFPLSWCEKFSEMVFVPTPLHQRRIFFRGFNQSQILAQMFSVVAQKKGKKSSVEKLLVRVKNTLPQAHLKTEKERHENISGAFCLKENGEKIPQDMLIILVDDVCSSGSTMEEMRATLEKNGFKNVVGMVFARP